MDVKLLKLKNATCEDIAYINSLMLTENKAGCLYKNFLIHFSVYLRYISRLRIYKTQLGKHCVKIKIKSFYKHIFNYNLLQREVFMIHKIIQHN